MKKPKIAVSGCLLGKKVRYNGEDTFNSYISNILPKFFKIIPFCPELEMGMGVPREPVNLVEVSKENIRMIGEQSGKDYTSLAKNFAKIMAHSLADVDGIIFQEKSPSCGAEKVKVHKLGSFSRKGRGIFAQVFIDLYPDIPCIDSKGLKREYSRFQEDVYSYFNKRKG